MKRVLTIVVVIIGLLASLYGISYDTAYDGIESTINNIATSLAKVGSFLLPNEFSSPYIESGTLDTVLSTGGTISEYLSLKGIDISNDIIYDRAYTMEHKTYYGWDKLYTYELIRVTRTENGKTFDIYFDAKGEIYYNGGYYEYIMVDGLYIEFYRNKNSFDTYNADAIGIGKPTINETTQTLKEVIIRWID